MGDMNYLMNKPIAVLGAGAIGKAIAADCKLTGSHEVRICDLKPFSDKSLFRVKENGITIYGEQINLYGFQRSGTAVPDIVTESVAEAVKDAGIIIIAIPGLGHKVFFEQLIPCLEDGMVIHIIPDNYGCLLLRKMMREVGCNKKVIIGGWLGPAFDARVDIKGGITLPSVKLGYRALYAKGCALPECDTDQFFESTRYIPCFDSMLSGDGLFKTDTILGLDLSMANPILHTVGLILGVGVMENFETILGKKIEDFSIYTHAFCPSISRVQYAFYLETIKIAEKVGVKAETYEKEIFFSRESIVGAKYMGQDYVIPFEEIDHIAIGTGPFSVNSRYLTEDIPIGCHLLHLLGKKYGVETPVIDSMIALGSAILEKDFYAYGMQLSELGIESLSDKELFDYLRKGNYPK